ncbi:MAG: NAD(P)-binding domain-containing protein [bacterium]|nr:NAD(P)-binding domain-containing protein [bacterium]
MRIAIIGTGNIGGRLARGWAAAGHTIRLGSRDPAGEKVREIVAANPDRISAHSLAAAAESAEVVAIAVHPPVLREVCEALGEPGDRILIDTMNTMFRKPGEHATTAAALKAWTGSERVVKILNNTGAENVERPQYGGAPIDTFYCADDSEAGRVAAGLAEDLGFRAWDTGGLENAELLEAFAALWVTLAIKQGHGRDIAFKLLSRSEA